jgi:hypothetical protein
MLQQPAAAIALATTGAICVSPTTPPARISPGGEYNPATLTLKIDKRDAVLWPHKNSVTIDGLDRSIRHLVVLTSDGKRIQSFWFRRRLPMVQVQVIGSACSR